MTTSDLIWRLIEILLKDKEKIQMLMNKKKTRNSQMESIATALLFFGKKTN